jgi:hypothetical protein
MINRLILIMFVLMSVGCASVPMADPALDQQAKQFQPNPDSAGVYIYRNEMLGAAITLGLSVDGKPIGKTASKTCWCAPGRSISQLLHRRLALCWCVF